MICPNFRIDSRTSMRLDNSAASQEFSLSPSQSVRNTSVRFMETLEASNVDTRNRRSSHVSPTNQKSSDEISLGDYLDGISPTSRSPVDHAYFGSDIDGLENSSEEGSEGLAHKEKGTAEKSLQYGLVDYCSGDSSNSAWSKCNYYSSDED